jgi:hypothetical protein
LQIVVQLPGNCFAVAAQGYSFLIILEDVVGILGGKLAQGGLAMNLYELLIVFNFQYGLLGVNSKNDYRTNFN